MHIDPKIESLVSSLFGEGLEMVKIEAKLKENGFVVRAAGSPSDFDSQSINYFPAGKAWPEIESIEFHTNSAKAFPAGASVAVVNTKPLDSGRGLSVDFGRHCDRYAFAVQPAPPRLATISAYVCGGVTLIVEKSLHGGDKMKFKLLISSGLDWRGVAQVVDKLYGPNQLLYRPPDLTPWVK